MDEPPKRPVNVVHSEGHADALIRAGWRLRTMLRAPGDEEPYEYVLEWPHESEPAYPKNTTTSD
jgi:hypothetical protein